MEKQRRAKYDEKQNLSSRTTKGNIRIRLKLPEETFQELVDQVCLKEGHALLTRIVMYPNEVFYHHKNILRTKSTLLDLIIISWDFRHLIPYVKDRNTYYSILKWKQDREMVYLVTLVVQKFWLSWIINKGLGNALEVNSHRSVLMTNPETFHKSEPNFVLPYEKWILLRIDHTSQVTNKWFTRLWAGT